MTIIMVIIMAVLINNPNVNIGNNNVSSRESSHREEINPSMMKDLQAIRDATTGVAGGVQRR